MMYLLLFMGLAANAATIIVDQSGAGDALTIEEGASLLSEGDTLEIAAGSYITDAVDLRSLDDIVIVGYGQDATFVGATTNYAPLWISNNASISNICFVDWYGSTSGLDLSGYFDEDSILVDSCTFENTRLTHYGAGDLDVLDSAFLGSSSELVTYYNMSDRRVENSLFVESQGIRTGYSGHGGYGSFSAVHNTFIDTDNSIVVGEFGLEFTTIITNNLIVGGGRPWSVYLSPDDWDVIAYNVLSTDITEPGVFTGQDGATADIHDNLVGDPIFLDFSDDGDWTNDDLRPAWGSPVIDVGGLGYDLIGADRDGVPRPQDGDLDGVALPDVGAWEYDPDLDDDGWAGADAGGEDCDDNDPAINPDAEEVWYDGVDQDCDGDDDDDQDGDGFPQDADCDDTDPAINPGAEEVWYDGVDQDCDGDDDYDQDGDGFPQDDDCDDTDAEIYPGAEGWTEDCDPVVEDTGRPDDDKDPDPDDPWGCAAADGRVAPPVLLLLAAVPLFLRRREQPVR